jgi:hypothetical protein
MKKNRNKRLPVEERNWLSETEAAKKMGVKNNHSFYTTFVETHQIDPIIFPGRKQRRYLKADVEALNYINKKPVNAEPEPEHETRKEFLKRTLQKFKNRRVYA